MEISPVNGVKSNLNVEKQENSEINSVNIEPKKDGDKKIALALAALATAAAAGVGVAVAAKKGKINLSTLENSVQNAADDIGKVVKDTADDAAKAAKGAADDVGKVVKDTADDAVKGAVDDVAKTTKFQPEDEAIKEYLELLKNCKDPEKRATYEYYLANAQSKRWELYPRRNNVHFSDRDFKTWEKRLFHFNSILREMTTDETGVRSIAYKKERVCNEIKKLFEQKKGSELTPKMKGLMKELTKYTGKKFDTPQQAMRFIIDQEAKVLYNL